jgi:hypothetical protein
MGTVRRGWLVRAVLASLSLLFVPSQALGQSDATRAAARDLGAEGVEDFQAGNFQPASAKLTRAFEILRVPSLGLWSARALAKVGKLVEASERYLDVTRLDASKGDTAVQRQAQTDAAVEREALLPRIAGLTLEVKGAEAGDVSLTLDGAPVLPALIGVRQPANPGKHVAEARQGGRAVREEVTLAEGQRLSLTLDFANATAAPADPSAGPASGSQDQPASSKPTDAAPVADARPRKVPAGVWVGVAIAGVGLATGGVTAVLASQKKSDLDCPNDRCAPSQSDEVDSHNQLLTLSTVGFVAAGVGLATAGVFWFTRPKEPERAGHVTPWLGLGSAGLRGTF